MIQSLFLFFFLNAYAQPDWSSLGQDKAWLKLLHYLPTHKNGQSIVREESFFLHPEGRSRPDLELEALFNQLNEKKDLPDSPACRFPARTAWLSEKLNQHWNDSHCEAWQSWQQNTKSEKLNLLFASAFINSPASMYGHVLLRWQRAEKPDLKDYTLSFGADTRSAGGLAYIYYSLSGKFPGFFATAPFYLKVREYNDTENRDFWEYELLLSAEARKRLQAHAWEVKNFTFDYLFLTRNCAYFILDILEIADPSLTLLDDAKYWMIPADIVRLLVDKKIAVNSFYRPAQEKIMQASLDRLTNADRELAYEWADDPTLIPKNSNPNLTRAIYEVYRFKQGPAVALNEQEQIKEKIILDRMAEAPAKSPEVSGQYPPESGHPSAKTGAYFGNNQSYSFGQWQFRAAYHDLIDPIKGYDPYGELKMFEMNFRWSKRKFYLQDATLVKILSVAPGSYRNPKVSWNISIGAQANQEANCIGWSCVGPHLEGGVGWSLNFFQGKEQTFFAFIELEAEIAKNLAKGGRLAWGPYLGWRWPMTDWWRILAEWRRKNSFWGAASISQWQIASAWSLGKKWEARFWRKQWRSEQEWAAGLSFYY